MPIAAAAASVCEHQKTIISFAFACFQQQVMLIAKINGFHASCGSIKIMNATEKNFSCRWFCKLQSRARKQV